ncbi:hypothetical protein NDK50_07910 [Paraburkholderia bryophila]|uniref:phage neck terminator protein n=1 Tax=Paraburkholderia bryophila TaxID=420952 RepID=UPI00234AEDCB|nr:hypothetical protein [Paraburkholderia bryophila]WCM21361.1 hypothetical protein NDK50_07910 [Paraburkholderia bryophila]
MFQQMIVGLTGLPGNMVRPRWQPTVPKQPEATINWCSIGVTNSDADANPVMAHSPAGNGSDSLLRNEVLTILASFYGPNASAYAAQARDGIFISQNNDMLTANSMGLVSVGDKLPVPELVNQQWIRRFDFEIRIRRQVVRTYNVLNILSAQATIDSDPLTESIDVSQ